jgi:hypothetical protein
MSTDFGAACMLELSDCELEQRDLAKLAQINAFKVAEKLMILWSTIRRIWGIFM